MLLIISAIIIGTAFVFNKKVRDEFPMMQNFSTLDPKYWGTGDRYLVGDFITEYEFEKMKAKINSRNSKF